jgi:hypothetical protein
MELLATNQVKRARILVLIGAQIFLPALGRAQTVPLPEPPQVRSEPAPRIPDAACSE